MHHMYPISKGDQLCPLGFHPQVRWPTRCKRCFRDYKEHGSKRGDIAASSPSLSESFSARFRDDGKNIDIPPPKSWTSTSNLTNLSENDNRLGLPKRPASWTSTPDLDDNKRDNVSSDVTINIALPKRRHTTVLDIAQMEESITIKRPPLPPTSSLSVKDNKEQMDDLTILKSDSLAERVRKMQLIKKQNSVEREGSRERSIPRKTEKIEKEDVKIIEPEKPKLEKKKEPQIKITEVEKKKEPEKKQTTKTKLEIKTKPNDSSSNSQDVQFLIHIKKGSVDQQQEDSISTCTDTTDTTLVDKNDYEQTEQIESLKRELEIVKQRCERAERDKSDILLRRLASMDTGTNRTAASEALKLQQKVNELKEQNEELRDDKKSLSLKVRELEQDLHARPARNVEEELRSKLQAAETLCEELMDENEDMKRELTNMEQEIDEMQDNFREDQADEYTTVKKELEQTTKNCRILSFKLKKSERKIEQLETDKQQAAGSQTNSELSSKIKALEEELKTAHEVSRRLQSEADLAEKNSLKKKAPSLGMIGKSTSADGKFSREAMTRGGSQDDPAQILRDLHDSMEREADLREQVKFAEEEAENLRKKASRVEDENESLMMQLKKMATKARSRKLSPTAPPSRLSPASIVEKDEGISDEEDPAELRLLLELNEQEASVLRRKVEELEIENETNKKKLEDLQSKLNIKGDDKSTKKLPSFLSKSSTINVNEKKLKGLEVEIADLKKKMTEKDKTIDKLQTDIKKPKLLQTKTKSIDGLDQQTVDFKRQLQIVEQEVSILRTKNQSLEQESEKLGTENTKLQLQLARSTRKDSVTGTSTDKIVNDLKDSLLKVVKERDDLTAKLKKILEDSASKLPVRIPKKYSETNTKLQLKKIIEELEDEVIEMRAIVVRTNSFDLNKLEKEKLTALDDIKELRTSLDTANVELKAIKSKHDTVSLKLAKLGDVEKKIKTTETENNKFNDKIKLLEDKITKQDTTIKQMESAKTQLEQQIRTDKENKIKIENDLEKEKKERIKLEKKLTDLDAELQTTKKNATKTKTTLDNEIASLKSKNTSNETPSSKLQELKDKINELEANAVKETKKYAELTGKYESLEEAHILTKAQLTTDKNKLGSEITTVKSQLNKSTTEETKLKKDNVELNKKLTESKNKLADLEKKDSKTNSIELEKQKLKAELLDKEREFERLKSENEMNIDLSSQLKKENEEVRRKLDDFEKVNKVQRTLNEHNNSLEQELKKMKMKLEHTELSVKTEVSTTKLRYEQQVNNMQAELNSMQRQLERFKKDRDTYKQLLEAAQKSMADLKQNSSGRASRNSINSGDEDDKTKIVVLEQQVGCLEDELSEARLDASKLKTELVSEKSASEIKISEMQSRLNEYEEERLMGSGRSKIPGLKTRLELSWQKERDELQRLLQETSTLARDLRQTLFEVERERDKDKLESRRRIEQLKKGTEEEMEEGRKKISELQCDLLDLRDAHAKLRTANEKLRRERERYERERDNATKRRMEQDGDRKVGALLQTVEEFVKIAPELQLVSSNTVNSTSTSTTKISTNQSSHLKTPNPPIRSKSRSPSPGPGSQQPLQISGVLSRLAEAYEELRKYQKFNEDEKEKDKFRRGSMRRAASTENESDNPGKSRITRSSPLNGSLYRKSLSLDQSIHQDQLIWKQDDGSMSSMQSIDSEYGGMIRDSSMDSRLSGGSTQSDMPRGPRKKKRGLMGKLRSLTKSSRGTESDGSHHGSDSDVSLSEHRSSSKKDLKERLSGMFRRSGSSSRSSEQLNSSTKRPVAVTTLELGSSTTKINHGTPNLKRSVTKPPTSSSTSTPSTLRKSK